MNEPAVRQLDDLADEYAARWSAERPAPEAAQPASRTSPVGLPATSEMFLLLTEFLPDYPRSGINE